MKYDDGCKKIFLYTKGETSSQSLKEMVEYMADSNVEHVTNQDIETIHRAVSKVRQDKEVSIGYMKSWERDAMMREEGLTQGAIETLQEVGMTREEAVERVAVKFSLPNDKAALEVDKYWKQ